MDRFKMVVDSKFARDEGSSTVRLVMVEPSEVPAVMTWHYPIPLEDIDDQIGDEFEVIIRRDEGPLS